MKGTRFIAVAAAIGAVLVPASPAAAVGRDFFGVVPANTPTAEEFDTMDEARVGTYRFQLDWSNVQPTEGGPYDWSAIDERVGTAAANGIESLPFFYGSPGYAADSNREPPLGSAEAKQGWKEFVAAAVERYGRGGEYWTNPALFAAQHPGAEPRPIRAVQIWNEQNSPSYYHPKPSVKEYAELLKISDEAVESANGGTDIVLGGMFGTPSRNKGIFSWKFLKRLYKNNGAKQHIDAVALHPYSPNLAGIKIQVELAREKIKKAGGGKPPLWITELGWGSAGTNGHDLIKSPQGQRKMLQKSFNLLLDKKGKWKVRRLLWFSWRDPADGHDPVGVICTWCASAGLLEQDGTPKPSFDRFKRFTGAG
ncbi:MAG: glycosyl hydrolase [Actinomycetota bacterium]